jgi:hypothetical protein
VLADDVYWLVHHDATGRPRTAGRPAAVMLAAAVLAELVAAGHACVVDGRVAAHVPVTAGDSLHAGVLAQIIAEDERYTLRQWLQSLAEDMGERVTERMVLAGRAARCRTSMWHRVQVVANPGDHSPAWVHAGLVDAVSRGDVLDQRQLFLLALAQHSSMTEHPLAGVDALHARYALSQLPTMPGSWQQLVAAAADLIRAAAITR